MFNTESKNVTTDCLANRLLTKYDQMFWKEITKINNVKDTPLASTANNVTRRDNIVNIWHGHFRDILNSSKDVSCKNYVIHEVEKHDELNLIASLLLMLLSV